MISWTGSLVEHVLDPQVKATGEKVTEDSPLQVTETARAQWPLVRYVLFYYFLLSSRSNLCFLWIYFLSTLASY